MSNGRARYPVTPDGRYFVVRGRLWRTTNPDLDPDERTRLARAATDADALADARAAVHSAKVALGERGAVWWNDGAPDFNRHLARNTPYRDWFEALPTDGGDSNIET
jgi:hypothetical protein